jgi:hypothetical protein
MLSILCAIQQAHMALTALLKKSNEVAVTVGFKGIPF